MLVLVDVVPVENLPRGFIRCVQSLLETYQDTFQRSYDLRSAVAHSIGHRGRPRVPRRGADLRSLDRSLRAPERLAEHVEGNGRVAVAHGEVLKVPQLPRRGIRDGGFDKVAELNPRQRPVAVVVEAPERFPQTRRGVAVGGEVISQEREEVPRGDPGRGDNLGFGLRYRVWRPKRLDPRRLEISLRHNLRALARRGGDLILLIAHVLGYLRGGLEAAEARGGSRKGDERGGKFRREFHDVRTPRRRHRPPRARLDVRASVQSPRLQ